MIMENKSKFSLEEEIESEIISVEEEVDRRCKKGAIGLGVGTLFVFGAIAIDAYLFKELNIDTDYVLVAGTIGLGAGFSYCIYQIVNMPYYLKSD